MESFGDIVSDSPHASPRLPRTSKNRHVGQRVASKNKNLRLDSASGPRKRSTKHPRNYHLSSWRRVPALDSTLRTRGEASRNYFVVGGCTRAQSQSHRLSVYVTMCPYYYTRVYNSVYVGERSV